MECKDCQNYYSCQYMQHRFAVKECEEHDMQVTILHSLELADRQEILREGNNIWK